MTSVTIAAVVPEEVDEALKGYAKKTRLSKSHIIREIVIGELTLKQIQKELA